MNNNDIINRLDTLTKEVKELRKDVQSDAMTINAHPVMFVILLVGFFVTMDLWAATAQSTLKRVHPRGYLTFWEYGLLAIVALILLLWVARLTGIKIGLLASTE